MPDETRCSFKVYVQVPQQSGAVAVKRCELPKGHAEPHKLTLDTTSATGAIWVKEDSR